MTCAGQTLESDRKDEDRQTSGWKDRKCVRFALSATIYDEIKCMKYLYTMAKRNTGRRTEYLIVTKLGNSRLPIDI